MDIGVVVAYLVSFLSGKAKSVANRVVDELLEKLYAKVAIKLRGDSSLRRLEDNPSDDQAQADVVKSLSAIAGSNEQLARELSQLLSELDRHGAQKLIVAAPVHGQVFQQVTADHGSIVGSIGRDVNITYQDSRSRELDELRKAGWFSKILIVLGPLMCLAGLGMSVYSFFTVELKPGVGFPPMTQLGFGIFFAGLVLIFLSRLSLMLRKK